MYVKMSEEYTWNCFNNAYNVNNYVDEEITIENRQEAQVIIKEIINKLSDEAKMVFHLIFEAPKEMETIVKEGISITRLTKYLLKNKKMKKQQIDKIYKEISTLKGVI